MTRLRSTTAPPSLDLGDTLAYLRVSSDSQAREEKTSLADQARAIAQLASRLGRTLAPRATFTDPGKSGQTAEDRPAFMALVAYAQAHPRPRSAPGLVLVLNDSRFGRFGDPDEAAFWRVVLAKAGWRVRFAEGDDTDDLVGRSVLRAIGGAQASAYSHALRANAKRGTRGAAALVASRLGRDAILIELNPAYAQMAERRVSSDAGMFADVDLHDVAQL